MWGHALFFFLCGAFSLARLASQGKGSAFAGEPAGLGPVTGQCGPARITCAIYRETARSSTIIPSDGKILKTLLDVELLRKAIYELGYELNNRPGWVNIAFQVLLDLLNPENPI